MYIVGHLSFIKYWILCLVAIAQLARGRTPVQVIVQLSQLPGALYLPTDVAVIGKSSARMAAASDSASAASAQQARFLATTTSLSYAIVFSYRHVRSHH